MREFFFGSSPPRLRMDLIRIAVWTPVFVVMSALWWHDLVFLWFIPMWAATTLLKHWWWRSHPPVSAPVTRYTKRP
jgi:hypothetical protein